MPSERSQEDRAVASVDLLILCYHAVSLNWETSLAVYPDRLSSQVQHLLRRGYRPKTLTDALSQPADGRTFVVTFDDGYRSILELGLPVLKDLGVPATVFVPTDLTDEAGLFTYLSAHEMPEEEEEIRCMSWDEVRRLVDAGWEVGSHTCTHPHLTEIDDRQLAVELERSREVCEERLQRPCESIAYPYGSHDARVMEATTGAGYRFAVTLESRMFEPISGRGPMDLPREGIFRETRWPKYLANTSRMVRRVRLMPWYERIAFGRLRSSHR
ncbi:MAG TPA: polysaccharide deacetylase family protein [Solirubrobacterales bacterium]|jgi:peptidoglycan/xylan/chitin deacetylase (PgdA/CDA1 family)|nr:polysaccharide deacetylase family protein [Solirubrobacterales bacterium]